MTKFKLDPEVVHLLKLWSICHCSREIATFVPWMKFEYCPNKNLFGNKILKFWFWHRSQYRKLLSLARMWHETIEWQAVTRSLIACWRQACSLSLTHNGNVHSPFIWQPASGDRYYRIQMPLDRGRQTCIHQLPSWSQSWGWRWRQLQIKYLECCFCWDVEAYFKGLCKGCF